MNRKKQGSLSSKFLKPKSQRSVSKQPKQRQSNIHSPCICQNTTKLNEFIQNYHILKHQYNFNLTSKNIYEQIILNQHNDEEFCFDVDLGVPYAESQHLDSGFEFDQKQNQVVNFPKVSSAKEIFTSVLEISNYSANQLEEENFTDQEEDQQNSVDFNKLHKVKKKSRKQAPEIFGKVQRMTNQQQNQKEVDKKSFPLSNLIQNAFNDGDEKQSIMQKLKMTAEFREEKLKFWNQRLVEMQALGSTNRNISRVSMISQKTAQLYNGQGSRSINSNVYKEPSKNEKNTPKLTVKRSKFEKEPIPRKSNLKPVVNIVKNKENVSPIKRKIQGTKSSTIKQASTKRQNLKKQLQIEEPNQVLTPSNSKVYLVKRREVLLKNQSTSRSKDKNLSRKIF